MARIFQIDWAQLEQICSPRTREDSRCRLAWFLARSYKDLFDFVKDGASADVISSCTNLDVCALLDRRGGPAAKILSLCQSQINDQ